MWASCGCQPHVWVEGNEVADRVAKASLGRDSIDVHVPFGRMECHSIISESLSRQWQLEWDKDSRERKLYNVHPAIRPANCVNLSRKDSIKWTRRGRGHCGLASGLVLVGKHRDGNCGHCGVLEFVQHVLIQCPHYAEERGELFMRLSQLGVERFSLRSVI